MCNPLTYNQEIPGRSMDDECDQARSAPRPFSVRVNCRAGRMETVNLKREWGLLYNRTSIGALVNYWRAFATKRLFDYSLLLLLISRFAD